MQRPLIIAVLILCASCFELRDKSGRYPLHNIGGEVSSLSILTFNILSNLDLLSLTKGYATWQTRRADVFATLKRYSPDLISLQEATLSQLDEFELAFQNDYELLDQRGLTPDAFMLVKRSRFAVLERGYWSLENPLDFRIRRIAVWAKLREKASGRELLFVATHLDAKDIREGEITILRKKLGPMEASGAPLFIAGDFNISSEHPDYKRLLTPGWSDSYKGDKANEPKTFPFKNPTRRIDHIVFFGAEVEAQFHQVLNGEPALEFSDHKAVFAKFHIKAAPAAGRGN